MVDSFKITLRRKLLDHSAVWREVHLIAKAVSTVHDNKGGEWPEMPWSLSADSRHWERATLAELRRIAREHSLREFTVYWDYAVEGLQWSIDGSVYEEFPSVIEIDAYAGNDRMSTERAAQAVSDAARRRGIHVEIGDTEISSTDSPSRSDSHRARKPTPFRDRRKGILSRVGAAFATHFPALLVTVVGGLAVIAVAFWLGF
ncbi:MAG: hypothetical protein ACOH14_04180 [Rhodoglobus sp.]